MDGALTAAHHLKLPLCFDLGAILALACCRQQFGRVLVARIEHDQQIETLNRLSPMPGLEGFYSLLIQVSDLRVEVLLLLDLPDDVLQVASHFSGTLVAGHRGLGQRT